MKPNEYALSALLWSETDDDGNSLDRGDYEASQELRDKVTKDWEDFREQAEALGFDAEEHLIGPLHPDSEGSAWNAAAYDFILTRNRHGCGFWDGDWEESMGAKLTDLCRKFGELSILVGDDGLLYPYPG
jgi:hypothetical protein